MSIISAITNIETAKTNIKTAIQNKGVTVPSTAKLADYPTYINQISGASQPAVSIQITSITFYWSVMGEGALEGVSISDPAKTITYSSNPAGVLVEVQEGLRSPDLTDGIACTVSYKVTNTSGKFQDQCTGSASYTFSVTPNVLQELSAYIAGIIPIKFKLLCTSFNPYRLNLGDWVLDTANQVTPVSGYTRYRSNSNYNVNNSIAKLKIEIYKAPAFELYINSYAESSYDYTCAYELDYDASAVTYSTAVYNGTGVKAHTRSLQKSPDALANFTKVSYPNDGGYHVIWITYRKDSSTHTSHDRGYILIKQ